MPQQASTSVENNFTKGLITEATGLNFPENAATDTDNCEYTLVGNVLRRQGVDYEPNFHTVTTAAIGGSVNTYKWNNAGGDGNSQIYVVQLGHALLFYLSSNATVLLPLSYQFLSGSVVDLNGGVKVINQAGDAGTITCEFADGNGYLFVYHPYCEPFYCTYDPALQTVTPILIGVQIRDFVGVNDSLPVTTRPATLSQEHQYNLQNQGWVTGNNWQANSSTTNTVGFGGRTWQIAAGLPITLGQTVQVSAQDGSSGIPYNLPVMSITVTSYAGTTLTGVVTGINTPFLNFTAHGWLFLPYSSNTVATWFGTLGSYPANADVWWYFKDVSGNFSPATTVGNTVIGQSSAPKGHYLLNPFSQQRDVQSGLVITDVATQLRPKTGTWFQGRVWYTGVDAQQAAVGNVGRYNWTENIYFSQIVQSPDDFGKCFQTNDPTSENLFDLLPTDGGVITIQGCGSIYKLFPTQNGLLVFAGNGIWFITGSQGIGFTANDYTITRISKIESVSSASFVDVLGLPFFWNEEGIYQVESNQSGQLQVNPITVGTIQTFYDSIPRNNKKYVRGAYDPIGYVIQWVYKDQPETGLSNRYQFNRILNYNTYNKCFYPYSIDSSSTTPWVSGITYISSPGGLSAPEPAIKYFLTFVNQITVGNIDTEEVYKDWTRAGVPTDYDSHFITGFKIRGQGLKLYQPTYIEMFSNGDQPTQYKIQGIWNYANNSNSGKYSQSQLVTNAQTNFNNVFRRHKIRGHGLVLQIKVSSVDGVPFNIIGWATAETTNANV